MKIPFTAQQFMDVFAAYNTAVWPMQVVFNLIALVIIVLVFHNFRYSNHIISILLSFFWLWMGYMYHIRFFAGINQAAYGFGAIFIIQGLLFIYYGLVKQALTFKFKDGAVVITGYIIIIYGLLLYPVISIFMGHWYPSAPTFGLPCPTTIFTLGLLLLADKRVPVPLIIIPLLWSVFGFMAAFRFGIWEDTGLLISGIVAGYFLIHRQRMKVIEGIGEI